MDDAFSIIVSIGAVLVFLFGADQVKKWLAAPVGKSQYVDSGSGSDEGIYGGSQ